MPDFDVVVVGAGVAGLAALAALDQAGLRVLCIEARNRIGGRVFTIHDPLLPIPVELGAEFIHGRPPEIWQIARSAPLSIYDCQDSSVDIEAGVVKSRSDSWEAAHHVMQDMRSAAAGGRDESFAAFLDRSEYPKRVKERSASFVEGFNAARREVIGIASLAKDAQAADEIDGDRSFRFFAGYDALPKHIFRSIPNGLQKLRLNTVLSAVRWRSGEAALQTVSPLGGQPRTISARRLLLTVPLGVLQAAPGTPGAIEWDPVPHAILESASALAFGQVVRVVLRFREAFWENDAHFADAGFLLSDEQLFPTWWSPLAARAPVWTGWSAGPHADPLLGTPESQVVERAVASLSRLLGTSASRVAAQLEHAYFHDWHADPFARGAYSYVPAGALSARERLALPVEDVLYFAGEATELRGHSATVHGALASGIRAAGQIIRAATR